MKPSFLLAGAALVAFAGSAYAQQTTPTTTDTGSATGAPAPDAGMAAPSNGMARPDAGTAAPSDTTAGAAAPSDAAPPATTAQDAGGQPAPGAATPAPAEQSATAAPAGGAAAAVQQDWAKYDPQNTGSLTPLAFGTWLMASRGQDMTAQVTKSQAGKQKNLPAVKVLNATASDFAKADTDHDRKITPGELTSYLSM